MSKGTGNGTPEEARQRDGHIPALDGLRGLAIIMVLFVHFVGACQPESAFERILIKGSNYGVWGVDLFFVLSGHLITGILYDSKGSAHYYRNFYLRRILRIFPLYYGVLFLLFFVFPLFPSVYPTGLEESARHQAWVWPFGVNHFIALRGWWALPYLSHFWSLAIEEHFYLLWPLVVAAATAPALMRICAGCAVFSLVLRIILSLAGLNEISLQVLTPCRFDALCTGGFLAIAIRSNARQGLIRMARPASLVLAASILFVSAFTAATHVLPGIFHGLRSSLIALFFGALLIDCVHAEAGDRIGRFFNHRAMRFFGKYSYGIYVFHGIIAFFFYDKRTEYPVASRVGSHLLAVFLQASIGVALSVLIALVSYQWFEKRFLRLKRWFGEDAPMVHEAEAEAADFS